MKIVDKEIISREAVRGRDAHKPPLLTKTLGIGKPTRRAEMEAGETQLI